MFNAPSATDVGFQHGHVGWGFEMADGTWVFGANEGPANGRLGGISKTWTANGFTWQNMLDTFAGRGAIYSAGSPYYPPGYYTTYKCTYVPAANPDAANLEAAQEGEQQFWLYNQDCESQVYNVLSKYGVSWLPYDITDPVPNSWYNALTSFTDATPLRS